MEKKDNHLEVQDGSSLLMNDLRQIIDSTRQRVAVTAYFIYTKKVASRGATFSIYNQSKIYLILGEIHGIE